MASSDRPTGATRDKRIIYKISDSRRHLVGPSRLGSLATLRHPNLPHQPVDPTPAVRSHLPDLSEQDATGAECGAAGRDSPAECAGFVAAGSWGASAPDTEAGPRPAHSEGKHPILDAIIEDSQPERRDPPGLAYGANPSVLDLIPELQRPQSYYYINSSCGPGSSAGSPGWLDGLDLEFPSARTSAQWSGHLKSVLLDVFQPSNDSGFPTVLQPRFKKTPGTSAALFVPSVMASIWRQYSEENEPTCPRVAHAAQRPIVAGLPNNADYAAPVSGSKTKGAPLNKGKNAKTASLSASTKRTPPYRGGARAADQTGGNGGTRNKEQNHDDMAGGRLARWQRLLKYVLVGLKQPQPSEHRDVELQDMSSLSPVHGSPGPTGNPETRPEQAEQSPERGVVTFFHYNSDGSEYTCTSEPVTVAPGADSRLPRGGDDAAAAADDMENRTSNASSDSLLVIGSDSEDEDEDEEEVIEAVLIQELDHGNCACTTFSNRGAEDGCTEEADSSSFINQPLSCEYSTGRIPNGNVNGNCLEKHESCAPKSTIKRRTSSIKRIPKIIRSKKKKVSFAVRSPNHKHGPKVLGFSPEDNGGGCDDKTCHRRTAKHRRRKSGPHSPGEDCTDEPFEWPDNYVHVKVPPRWTPPRNGYEADAYISVASRYVPNVYVKLYIQVPATTHLCELKTHLLICVFRSFFTTTEGLHVDWVMSLQSHVYNLLYMDVARVRFRRDSQGRPCRACLLLSRDATALVRHKRCGLLTTVADILQISPEELLVMEKGQRVGATRDFVWDDISNSFQGQL